MVDGRGDVGREGGEVGFRGGEGGAEYDGVDVLDGGQQVLLVMGSSGRERG